MATRSFVGVAHNSKRREYVVLTGIIQREGRNWVATVQETGTAVQARSINDLMERLEEAVGLHLTTLEDMGELDRFLIDNGIAIYKARPKKPRLEVSRFTPGSLATALIHQLPRGSEAGPARPKARGPLVHA